MRTKVFLHIIKLIKISHENNRIKTKHDVWLVCVLMLHLIKMKLLEKQLGKLILKNSGKILTPYKKI